MYGEPISNAMSCQPCDRSDAAYNERNLAACIDYIRRNPRWKLSLQLHKLLGIR